MLVVVRPFSITGIHNERNSAINAKLTKYAYYPVFAILEYDSSFRYLISDDNGQKCYISEQDFDSIVGSN